MANIIKFPAQSSKFGFKRVKKGKRDSESHGQMNLFTPPKAKILTLMPQASLFEEALMRDERGDPEAEMLYRKAIESGDCVADAYCNLGIIESQKGELSKAFDCFTQSLKYEPRHFESHYNLGNLYFDMNDLRLAQMHYELSLAIDPDFANAYFNLGLVQAMLENYHNAISILKRYRMLATDDEGAKADDLLSTLTRSVNSVN
ncbi:tetratricopeptide repeat protein [bacterium]|nr:tetratricopeptide repeat protein [bacterium]